MARRQGLRLVGWALLGIGLLAAAGRLDLGGLRPVATVPPVTGQPAPVTTVPVAVAIEQAPLPGAPARAAFGTGVLWVGGQRVVYHVLAGDGYQAATELGPGSGGVLDIAAGDGGVWLAVGDPGSAWHVDGRTGRVTTRIPLGQALTGTVRIAVSHGTGRTIVWVACCGGRDGVVLRVDPAAGRVLDRVPIPNGPIALAADPARAVVVTRLGEVFEVSAATATDRVLLRNSPGSRLGDVELTADGVWVAVPRNRNVLRRDLAAGRFESFPLPGGVRDLAAGRSGVWALSEDGLSVTPLSKGSLGPFGLHRVACDPAKQIVVGDGALWLVPERGNHVLRVSFPDNPELVDG